MSNDSPAARIDASAAEASGLPLEAIETARWVDYQERIMNPLTRETQVVTKKVLEINGVVIHTDAPLSNFRKYLLMFPTRTAFLPMEPWERQQYQQKRDRNARPAEFIGWNGLTYQMPKGVSVQVPSPIAEIVDQMNEPYRTDQSWDRSDLIAPIEGDEIPIR